MKLHRIAKGRKFRALNPERHRWTICYRTSARNGERACGGSYILDRPELAWQAVCHLAARLP